MCVSLAAAMLATTATLGVQPSPDQSHLPANDLIDALKFRGFTTILSTTDDDEIARFIRAADGSPTENFDGLYLDGICWWGESGRIA